MTYNIPSCSLQEEHDLLDMVMPWCTSVSFDVKTNRLVQIEVPDEKEFWFRLQIAYWLNPDEDEE
jgi:hypothetical protein